MPRGGNWYNIVNLRTGMTMFAKIKPRAKAAGARCLYCQGPLVAPYAAYCTADCFERHAAEQLAPRVAAERLVAQIKAGTVTCHDMDRVAAALLAEDQF